VRWLTVLLLVSLFGLVYWVHEMRVEDEIADAQEWQLVQDDQEIWREKSTNTFGRRS